MDCKNFLSPLFAGSLGRRASLASVSSHAESVHSTGSKGAGKTRSSKGSVASSCAGDTGMMNYSSRPGSEKGRQRSKDYLQQQREEKELLRR